MDLLTLQKKFSIDGAVHLKGALDSHSMNLALEAFDWSLANPSSAGGKVAQKTDGLFYQDLANPRAFPAYRRLLEESPAADIAAQIWDVPDVWFMYEQVFLKEGGESRRTPWHQDSSYLPVSGEQLLVMWITFEPMARESSLEFVRGSHRGTLFNASRFDPEDDTAPIFSEEILPRLPDIEANRSRYDIVSWPVTPGDVILFHPGMLHGGAPTHPGQRRRTLSLRFFGDDAIYKPHTNVVGDLPSTPSPDDPGESVFAKLPRSLKPGEPFRHPGFPKVRPRESR